MKSTSIELAMKTTTRKNLPRHRHEKKFVMLHLVLIFWLIFWCASKSHADESTPPVASDLRSYGELMAKCSVESTFISIVSKDEKDQSKYGKARTLFAVYSIEAIGESAFRKIESAETQRLMNFSMDDISKKQTHFKMESELALMSIAKCISAAESPAGKYIHKRIQSKPKQR